MGVAWRDRAYKIARRRGTAAAALTPAPSAVNLDPLITARWAWPNSPFPANDGFRDPTGVRGDRNDFPWN